MSCTRHNHNQFAGNPKLCLMHIELILVGNNYWILHELTFNMHAHERYLMFGQSHDIFLLLPYLLREMFGQRQPMPYQLWERFRQRQPREYILNYGPNNVALRGKEQRMW